MKHDWIEEYYVWPRDLDFDPNLSKVLICPTTRRAKSETIPNTLYSNRAIKYKQVHPPPTGAARFFLSKRARFLLCLSAEERPPGADETGQVLKWRSI